jgi:hypothetical protein
MTFRVLIAPCILVSLLAPVADAKTHRSHISRNAKYKHVTGAKHFKYKSPKTQKIKKH